MEIKVFIEKQNKTKTVLMKKADVKELLKKLKINPVTVIVVKENKLLTEDHVLKNKDKIKILSVVSGG